MVDQKGDAYQLKEVLGFQLPVTGNIDFSGYNTIFYLSSHHGVLHNLDKNTQRFIPFRQESEATAMSFGTNSNVAVAFRGQEPVVAVINLKTSLKRVLHAKGIKSEHFVYISFTEDYERLGAQGAGPDWVFALWQWEEKILLCTFNPFRMKLGAEILKFSFCSESQKDIAVVGRGFLRFYRMKDEHRIQETVIHQMERSKVTYLTALWIRDPRRALLGTSAGDILVFEHDVLKQQVSVEKELSRMNRSLVTDNKNISCLLLTVDGIMCSFGSSSILHLKKNFMLEKVLEIPECSEESEIIHLTINKEKDHMVAVTKEGRILAHYKNPTKGPDSKFQVVQPYQHTENVICVSTAKLVSVQASCSSSCFILRDMTTKNTFLRIALESAPVSVSLHPLGTSVVVGFQDCARVYTVLVDRLFEEKCFDSAENSTVSKVSFSPGGHAIAITSGRSVSAYYSIGFKELFSSELHKSNVHRLLWTDNYHLMSADADGVLVKWELAKKAQSWILRAPEEARVTSLAHWDPAADSSVLFVACSNCRLRQVKEGSWLHDTLTMKSPVTAMTIINNNTVLVVGTETGRIIGVHCSSLVPLFESDCHMGSVLDLALLDDSTTLVSVGIDGKMGTWRPESSLESGSLPRRQLVLVSKEEQEETVRNLDNLDTELRALRRATVEGRKRDKEAYAQKEVEVQSEQCKIRDSLQDTSRALEEELKEIRASAQREFEAKKADILKEMEYNEKDFESKMAKEKDYMNKLVDERTKMERKFEIESNKLLEQRKHDSAAVKERCSQHQAKIEELEDILKAEFEKQRQIDAEIDSIVMTPRVVRQDSDGQPDVFDVFCGATPQYIEKRKELMKKIENLNEELEAERQNCRDLDNELKEEEEQHSNLKDTENELRRLIHQAEDDIARLDKIQQVKSDMTQQLEVELVELSIPTDTTIEKYQKILETEKEALKEVQEKLERVTDEHWDITHQLKSKERLEVTLAEKLEAAEKSVKHNLIKSQSVQLLIEQLRTEFIRNTQDCKTNKELRKALLMLYENRVLKGSARAGSQLSEQTDLYSRFCHQRDKLENMINVVKHRTSLIESTFKKKCHKLSKEHSDWTSVREALIRDVEQKQRRVAALEAALGLEAHLFTANPAETRRRLAQAVDAAKLVGRERAEEVAKRRSLIQVQATEIARLHGLITVDEAGKIVRKVPRKMLEEDSVSDVSL